MKRQEYNFKIEHEGINKTFWGVFLLTCLVRLYTKVCRDGVQSTLSVYMPGIQIETSSQLHQKLNDFIENIEACTQTHSPSMAESALT